MFKHSICKLAIVSRSSGLEREAEPNDTKALYHKWKKVVSVKFFENPLNVCVVVKLANKKRILLTPDAQD